MDEFVMGVKNPGVKILKGVNIFPILGWKIRGWVEMRVNNPYSDMQTWISIDEWNAKTYIEILYWSYAWLLSRLQTSIELSILKHQLNPEYPKYWSYWSYAWVIFRLQTLIELFEEILNILQPKMNWEKKHNICMTHNFFSMHELS